MTSLLKTEAQLQIAAGSVREVAQALAEEIRGGRWPRGARLPSTRELGRRLGASSATVFRALRQLERTPLLEAQARRGWFVKAGSNTRTVGGAAAPRSLTGKQIAVSVSASITGDLTEQRTWSGQIVGSFCQSLAARGLDLLMLLERSDTVADPQAFLPRIDQVREQLAGVFFLSGSDALAVHAGLEQRGLSWVMINRPELRWRDNFAATDQLAAGRLIGHAFARLGYQRVLLLLSHLEAHPSSQEQLEGFCGGYAAAAGRLPAQLEVRYCGDSPEHVGHQGVQAFLEQHSPPQGIFAAGDYLALGAMRACQERGLNVPRDVGVVGNSGLPVGEHATPALTTIGQPMRQIGAAAVDMLLHMAQHALVRLPGRLLPPRIILRDSLPVTAELRRELERMSAPPEAGDRSQTATAG